MGTWLAAGRGSPCLKNRDMGHRRLRWGCLVSGGGVRGELGSDPAVGACIEQVERKHAAAEHLVVEGADVEPGAELALGAVAEFAELHLAELVAERLGGPGDV